MVVVMQMRKQLLAAGMLLALTACATPKTAQIPVPEQTPVAIATPTPAPERPDYVDHPITLGEDEYIVRLVGAEGEKAQLGSLALYKSADLSAPIQTFSGFVYDAGTPLDSEFIAEDMNFDGFLDFHVYGYRGQMGKAYFYWLWSPESAQFVFWDTQENIREPVFDSGSKLVYTTVFNGVWGAENTVYRWVGERLIPVLSFNMYANRETVDNDVCYAIAEDGVLTVAKEWSGPQGAWGDKRIPPEAEPYFALTEVPAAVTAPTDGEYFVWRLVYMGPGRPMYAARLTSDYTDEGPGVKHNSLRQIDFYALGNLETPLQTIPLEGGDSGMFPPGTAFGFGLEDLNFDGWPDLRFFHLLGTVNAVDYCLLYDPASGTFSRNETLEGICFLEADPEKQVLRGWARGGWGMYYDEIYRWIGDELTLIRQVNSYPPEEGMETDTNYTVSDYVNGALVVVKEYKNVNWEQTKAHAELERWKTDPDYHGEGAE